jgi:hypothetical protein
MSPSNYNECKLNQVGGSKLSSASPISAHLFFNMILKAFNQT